MTSLFRLYYSTTSTPWELIPSKLFKIDDIESYLATKSYQQVEDVQYIKHGLEIEVKLNLTQDQAQPLASSGFKYMSIRNGSEETCYYYVKKTTWRSKTCVRFELVMDVLNSLAEGTHYSFKDNTKITREHKDRFKLGLPEISIRLDHPTWTGDLEVGDEITFKYEDLQLGWQNICQGKILFVDIYTEEIHFMCTDGTDPDDIAQVIEQHTYEYFSVTKDNSNYCEFQVYDYDIDRSCFRVIDPVAEGINPVLQCGDTEGRLVQHNVSLLQQDWYLLYRNVENPVDDTKIVNPVECFLIPQNITDIYIGVTTSGQLVPATLNANTWYYARIPDGVSFTLSNGYTKTSDASNDLFALVITKQQNQKLAVSVFYSRLGVNYILLQATYDDISYITFSAFPIPYESFSSPIDERDWRQHYWLNESKEWGNEYEGDVIDGIESLDRTDVKNIKLIKMPYCPYAFEVFNNKLQVAGTDWVYTTFEQADESTIKVIKLNDLNVKLNGLFERTESEICPLYRLQYNDPKNHSITALRKGIQVESKLFHSEFVKPTYVYDSFTFVMQLEKLNLESYFDVDERKLKIKFTMTSTINSKFMFTFTSYHLERGDENYAKYMVISRNNEEVLYNIPYINYIRTGYNYDKKQKALQNTSNYIGVGLSLVALGASLFFPSVSLKVAGVVGSFTSLAANTKNAVMTAIKSEEDLRQKLIEKKQESASIEGSDDVDLMSEYAKNRIKYLEYTPSTIMKNLLFDLFFYAGYSSGRMGKPNHTTRVNFDYLEADVSLETAGQNVSEDIIEELKNCFKAGVTYIHKTSRVSDKWDIAQKYENWEVSLLEE